jgi:hypothetical protein
MFKTLLTASAALAVSTPAFAGPTLMGEVRIGDVRENRGDSTEYKVEFSDSVLNALNYGLELQTKQAENAGDIKSLVSFKAGPVLQDFYGIHPAVYGEIGTALGRTDNYRLFWGYPAPYGGIGTASDNYKFWGAGAKASYALVGPVSVSVGYRHREGISHESFNEDRLNGGFSVAVTDNYVLGAQYYRTRGTTNSDAVGLSVTRKF